jgi:hypothetical protein
MEAIVDKIDKYILVFKYMYPQNTTNNIIPTPLFIN